MKNSPLLTITVLTALASYHPAQASFVEQENPRKNIIYRAISGDWPLPQDTVRIIASFLTPSHTCGKPYGYMGVVHHKLKIPQQKAQVFFDPTCRTGAAIYPHGLAYESCMGTVTTYPPGTTYVLNTRSGGATRYSGRTFTAAPGTSPIEFSKIPTGETVALFKGFTPEPERAIKVHSMPSSRAEAALDPAMHHVHTKEGHYFCYPTLSRGEMAQPSIRSLIATQYIHDSLDESPAGTMAITSKNRNVWRHVPEKTQTVLWRTGFVTLESIRDDRGTKRIHPSVANPLAARFVHNLLAEKFPPSRATAITEKNRIAWSYVPEKKPKKSFFAKALLPLNQTATTEESSGYAQQAKALRIRIRRFMAKIVPRLISAV